MKYRYPISSQRTFGEQNVPGSYWIVGRTAVPVWKRGEEVQLLPGTEHWSFNPCSSQSTDSSGFIRACKCKLLKRDLSLRKLDFVEDILYMTQKVSYLSSVLYCEIQI